LPGHDPPAGTGFPTLTHTGVAPPSAADPGNPCPDDAPQRRYDVSAINQPIEFNRAAGLTVPNGRIYVLNAEIDAVRNATKAIEPLVIRANAGDCLTVVLTNAMTDQPASFHVDAASLDARGSLGITLGFNAGQVAQPQETVTYRYYLPSELGTVLIRDFGNIYRNAREGLYGALIVEPAGASYTDPHSGEPLLSGVAAVISQPNGETFREFVTIFQDNDPDIGLFVMPYDEEVNRIVGVNYRAEPLSLRLAAFDVLRDADPIRPEDAAAAAALFSAAAFGDPTTNVFQTYAGDPVRFRVVSAYSEQNQVFSVEGHQWQLTPQIPGSDVVSSRYLPPTAVLNVQLDSSGGVQARPGDYLWLNHRLPFLKAGQWGILRVLPVGAESGILPLGGP
jgi:FtsP/CotA-like multicopper oxidase with cupredoxin domain